MHHSLVGAGKDIHQYGPATQVPSLQQSINRSAERGMQPASSKVLLCEYFANKSDVAAKEVLP